MSALFADGIQTGNELKVLEAHVLEPVVDPVRTLCALFCHHAKGVEFDIVLFQKLQVF